MFARLAFAVLVLAAFSGLAAVSLALARAPVPTPTATVQPEATPTATASPAPLPTRPAPPEPLPAGCVRGAAAAPLAPDAPSALSVLMEANPNLPDLPPTVTVLRWKDNSTDELCFAIERRVGDGPWQWLSAVQSEQRGTYDDGPATGGPVCYRVSAGDNHGRSAYSNEACLIAPTPTPPAPPWDCEGGSSAGPARAPDPPSGFALSLRSEPGLPPLHFIDLTWEDNSTNEACFEVEFSKGDGAWYAWARAGPDQTAFLEGSAYGDLPGMAGWCFHVLAVNQWGRSEPSNEACLEAPPTPTPTPVGCDMPTPTPGPGMTPFPWSTASVPPTAPSDLRAELVPDPELEAGLAVEVTWQDNADNDACYFMEVRIDGELKRGWGVMLAEGGSAMGANTWRDIPDRTGTHCYRIYYGNSAGRAYSNEACASVETVPVWSTPTQTATPAPASPTPLPDACRGEGPVGAPGAPNPPTEFHAALSSGSDVCEGFIVRLRWDDNAADELCYVIERKVGAGDWALYQAGSPEDPVSTGTVSVEDIPQRVGVHCYRVYYGNEAGRSAYSDERCVLVEVVPRVITSTPLFSPTPAPTRPPGCNFERQVGSPRAPNTPSNLRVALRDEPGLPQPAFVDLSWDDNSPDEACFVLTFEGPWWITETIGPDQATFSKAAYGQRCGMAGYWCLHVSAANEWGMSQPSNKVCLDIEPGAASTPAATAMAGQAAAVGALPTTAGASDGGGLAWWWWALVAAGSVTLMAAVGLAWVAHGRPSR